MKLEFCMQIIGDTLVCGVALLLDGLVLLEHSSVEQLIPLLTICSTMPSQVDADVEGLNISGNSFQPSFSGKSSSSCGWVVRFSYQDFVIIFITKKMPGDHSPEKPGKVREFQSGQGKVGGSEIRCVFSSSKYSKTRFSARAPPRVPLGELTMLPQLLLPQLLNNWLSASPCFSLLWNNDCWPYR